MTDELQPKDADRAWAWYRKHWLYVGRLLSDFGPANKTTVYPPTEEDVPYPELWKRAHWRWFLRVYSPERKNDD